MWQAVFGLTNAIAVVGWLLLLLIPHRPIRLVRLACVGSLCLVYVALFVALFAGLVDPVRTGPEPSLADYSVTGLRALFASDGGVVVGWTHYLAFDLFVGSWIAETADHRGVSRWVQAPVLLLTFLAGPVGLLLWFLLGRRKRR